MAKFDQFVASVLLLCSFLTLVNAINVGVSNEQERLLAVVTAMLGIFAGILNLLRVAYMRYARGLRVCSVVANIMATVFILAVWYQTRNELAAVQTIPGVAAIVLSLAHRPKVRINGLGKFDFGAGG